MKKDNYKIVFVGGHHTPALAVIDELSVDASIFWLGHKYSMWKDKNPSAEYQEVIARKIPFYDLKAGKLYRTYNPLKLIRLPFGFFQSLYYLFKIKPNLIVSFGGYLAPPVVLAGWVFRIPSVTHEQTIEGGWANQFAAKFAQKVFVSWQESLDYFPKEKTVVTGNPIRRSILNLTQASNLNRDQNSKAIYISGGKQGSHVINSVVKESLSDLLRKYSVIHQTGRSTVFSDYDDLSTHRDSLSEELKRNYIVKDYFTESEIGEVLDHADVFIGRSGANIVCELAAIGKPAILIPLPWVNHNEQYRNAKLLVDAGSGVIIEEENFTSTTLIKTVNDVFANFEKYRAGGLKAKKMIKPDAAKIIASEISNILNSR